MHLHALAVRDSQANDAGSRQAASKCGHDAADALEFPGEYPDQAIFSKRQVHAAAIQFDIGQAFDRLCHRRQLLGALVNVEFSQKQDRIGLPAFAPNVDLLMVAQQRRDKILGRRSGQNKDRRAGRDCSNPVEDSMTVFRVSVEAVADRRTV